MSELQNILKEEYSKKDSIIEASELLRMVEEALDTVWEEVVVDNKEVIEEMAATTKNAKEFLLVLPKFVPTEAWGNPDSIDRKQINRLFSVIGGGRSIEGKLKFLARITEEDNRITSPRRIISSLITLTHPALGSFSKVSYPHCSKASKLVIFLPWAICQFRT